MVPVGTIKQTQRAKKRFNARSRNYRWQNREALEMRVNERNSLKPQCLIVA